MLVVAVLCHAGLNELIAMFQADYMGVAPSEGASLGVGADEQCSDHSSLIMHRLRWRGPAVSPDGHQRGSHLISLMSWDQPNTLNAPL